MARVEEYYRRERRRERADHSEFDTLIATPQDLGNVAASGASSALVMPAKSRLAISHSVALSASDVTIDIGARRTFSHPDLAADELHNGWYAERSQDIVINRGAGAPAGTFTLYVIREHGKAYAIATATFTV